MIIYRERFGAWVRNNKTAVQYIVSIAITLLLYVGLYLALDPKKMVHDIATSAVPAVVEKPSFEAYRYYLLKIEENGEQLYAITHCDHDSVCSYLGYRWAITEDGLAEATRMYEHFQPPPPPPEPERKILEVIRK